MGARPPTRMHYFSTTTTTRSIPLKREKIFRLITQLKKDGIPVHGLGLQAQLGNNGAFRRAAGQHACNVSPGLGVQLQITELDVSVYPKEHERRERRPEDADAAFTSEREQQQTAGIQDDL